MNIAVIQHVLRGDDQEDAVALASAAAAGGLTVALANLMTIAKLKFAVGAVVVAGLGTALVIEQQAWITLRRQNEAGWQM